MESRRVRAAKRIAADFIILWVCVFIVFSLLLVERLLCSGRLVFVIGVFVGLLLFVGFLAARRQRDGNREKGEDDGADTFHNGLSVLLGLVRRSSFNGDCAK
jgi:hypothetical protein